MGIVRWMRVLLQYSNVILLTSCVMRSTMKGATKLAVVPMALAMPTSIPAYCGAMSRWLTMNPPYWKPRKVKPVTKNATAAFQWAQPRNPDPTSIPAGIIVPAQQQNHLILAYVKVVATYQILMCTVTSKI